MYHDLWNAIIMRNVIYAEWLKEINLTQNKEFTKCRLDYDDKWRSNGIFKPFFGELEEWGVLVAWPFVQSENEAVRGHFSLRPDDNHFTRQILAFILPTFKLNGMKWNTQAIYWRDLQHICKYLRGWLFALFEHHYHSFHSTRVAPLREYSFLSLFEMSSTTQRLFF